MRVSCYTSGQFDDHLRSSLTNPSYRRAYVLSTYLNRDLAKLLAGGAGDRRLWVIVKLMSYTRRSVRDSIRSSLKYLKKELNGSVRFRRNEDLALNMFILVKGARASKRELGELIVSSFPTPAPRSEKAVKRCGFVLLTSTTPKEVTEARQVFEKLWSESLMLRL